MNVTKCTHSRMVRLRLKGSRVCLFVQIVIPVINCVFQFIAVTMNAYATGRVSSARLLHAGALIGERIVRWSLFQTDSKVIDQSKQLDTKWALHSAGSNRLQFPPFKLSTVGGRAFSVAAARFWNRLPDNMSRRPIRCRLFSSNWNTLCSSSHSHTLSCDIS